MTILDSLEAAEAKATAGPWEWRANVSKGECVQAGSAGLIFTPRRDDAALIALLRNHAADLLAVARAAQNPNALRGDLDRALAPLTTEGSDE